MGSHKVPVSPLLPMAQAPQLSAVKLETPGLEGSSTQRIQISHGQGPIAISGLAQMAGTTEYPSVVGSASIISTGMLFRQATERVSGACERDL